MTRHDVRDELAHLREEAAALVESYLARPLLRGFSHLVASLTALGAVIVLTIQAVATIQLIASLVYGIGLILALGTSATYHLVRWRPRAYVRIRNLDHSMIYVLIASSVTPFALIVLDGGWRYAALAGFWLFAAGGIALRWLVEHQPRWLKVSMYLAMGWATLALLPELQEMSRQAFVLTVVGGVLYTIGGLIYLVGRPNPFPRVFGFHEVFHAFVVAAATCHFIAVWPLITEAMPRVA